MTMRTSPIRSRSNGLKRWGNPLALPLLLVVSVAVIAVTWRATSCPHHNGGARTGTRELQEVPLRKVERDPASILPEVPNTKGYYSSSWALPEAEANWGVPEYSTHTCTGEKFEDNWAASTCKFDNVCINSNTQEIEYYTSPDYPELPVAYSFDGTPHDQFSEHLVNPGHSIADRLAHTQTKWRPIVKHQRFPTGPNVFWAPANHALLTAIPAKFLLNFGHVMYDTLVPLFNMQHLFGMYDPEAQILIAASQGDTPENLNVWIHRMINTPDPNKSILRLTWNNYAMWVGEYANAVLRAAGVQGGDGGLVCFRSLLAGTGHLSRRMTRVDPYAYRQAAIQHVGIVEQPQTRPVITVFNKQGRRTIENMEDVYAAIKARYPAASVSIFDFAKYPDITMKEQLQLMSDTSILVSPCGGIATVLAFLRPGATAIVANYWHTLRNRSVMMEDSYYRNLNYLDVQYFPVTLQDYSETFDRPGCELVANGTRWEDSRYPKSGSLVNCNIRFGPDSMQRMMNFVDSAMMRWASMRNRPDVVASIRKQPAGGEGAGAQEAGSAVGAAAVQ